MILSRPSLRGDQLVFISEDDLWTTTADGGDAHRLTQTQTRVVNARHSRDGTLLAVATREQGADDVYLMPASGGPLERRTWMGVSLDIAEFSPDDQTIRFSARRGGPLDKEHQLWETPVDQGVHLHLALGPVRGFAELDGRRVICRYADDLSRWKRYRGGRVGRLWVDLGQGFVELPSLGGNVASPFWLGERLGFLSDHEGTSNVYTCNADGSDLAGLSEHADFSARHAVSDGDRIVYEQGARIWRIDPGDAPRALPINTHSNRTRTQLRFPTASRFLGTVSPHPDGHSLAVTTRGRPFIGGHWEGPMVQLGERQGVRYRHTQWLNATRLVWVTDASGEETLQVHDLANGETQDIAVSLGGRVDAVVSDGGNRVAVSMGDCRLLLVDLEHETLTVISDAKGQLTGLCWSSDGRWLTWCESLGRWRSKIRLADTQALTDDGFPITDITDGRYADRAPDFDPLGRFLYFVSFREFEAVPDRIFFDYDFPKGARPYLVTLLADTPSPFQPRPRDFSKPKAPKAPEQVRIDLAGIADRVVRFPVGESNYHTIHGLPSGRVLLLRESVSSPSGSWKPGTTPPGKKVLVLWDYDTRDTQIVHTKVNHLRLDLNRKTLVLRSGNRLRVIPADADKSTRAELKKDVPYRTNRKTYWVDLNRIRLEVDPSAEWRQMALEAWRLMRDFFWEPDMAGVDWSAKRDLYLPLIEQAGCRSELSELLWAMLGEVATSHAYEMGGSYAPQVTRNVGRLAADLSWEDGAWVVQQVHRGDIGDAKRSSPLIAPGIGAIEGTRIHAIHGVPLTERRTPEAALIGHAGRPVEIHFTPPNAKARSGWIKPLLSDQGARYRSWVAANRARIRAETDGRVGYVHAPDMSTRGFADFHRDFLHECTLDGLIVDVRFNGGGHVSQMLLNRLMQRRLAYSRARHFGPSPYPAHAVLGPMVALTNENAGSDGDIFSYNWKALKLGPLIGTRTWGGVVGISPRNTLVDGTVVTQPEFAYWFDGGAGWNVEGYGVDPDIEVRHSPADYAAGLDPQLARAIKEINKRMKREKPAVPTFEPPPTR